MAVPKPTGGVRPIAIGEVLRRLTAKCLTHMVQDDARRTFWPAQPGVGVRAGVEIGVHTTRAWAQRNKGPCQTRLRQRFQPHLPPSCPGQCHQALPHHFPRITWCYQRPSNLRFGSCTGGVEQGDPLGPLPFAVAIRELVTGPLDLALFYLDDGVLAGDVAAVGAGLAHLQARGAALGLQPGKMRSGCCGTGAACLLTKSLASRAAPAP